MLARVGSLFKSRDGLAFHDKDVKILGEEHKDRLRHRAHDAGLDIIHHIENGERAILENRIGV